MIWLVERREVLARFRAGDRSALEEVYRHYAPLVSQFLSRGFIFNSGDRVLRFAGYREPFDLDNALQEVFMRAFRAGARERFDGLRPYRGYLFAVAKNFVLDELRSQGAERRVMVVETDRTRGGYEGGNDFEEAPGGEPTAEDTLLDQELGTLCAAFTGVLGDVDRAFFEARFTEQLTQVEAGERVGLSHMQARSLEKKLRRRLLGFLQSRGWLEGYVGMEARA